MSEFTSDSETRKPTTDKGKWLLQRSDNSDGWNLDFIEEHDIVNVEDQAKAQERERIKIDTVDALGIAEWEAIESLMSQEQYG